MSTSRRRAKTRPGIALFYNPKLGSIRPAAAPTRLNDLQPRHRMTINMAIHIDSQLPPLNRRKLAVLVGVRQAGHKGRIKQGGLRRRDTFRAGRPHVPPYRHRKGQRHRPAGLARRRPRTHRRHPTEPPPRTAALELAARIRGQAQSSVTVALAGGIPSDASPRDKTATPSTSSQPSASLQPSATGCESGPWGSDNALVIRHATRPYDPKNSASAWPDISTPAYFAFVTVTSLRSPAAT